MIYKSSHIGNLHEETNSENQDYICTRQSNSRNVISLADGVSSCSEGKAGAEIAGEAITHLMMKKGDLLMEYEDEQIARIIIGHILGELEKKATAVDESVEEFSSTVASVLYDERNSKILCFNLGDGIIISISDNGYHIVSKPFDSSDGCCVTTTINAHEAATIRFLDPVDTYALIICSDGAWRHIFAGNRMKPEAAELIETCDFAGLENFLDQQNCGDDYSFVSLKIYKGSMA